jgi:hypothetical protein
MRSAWVAFLEAPISRNQFPRSMLLPSAFIMGFTVASIAVAQVL